MGRDSSSSSSSSAKERTATPPSAKHCKPCPLPGTWSDRAPLLIPRERFSANTGPDQSAKFPLGVDQDPRVYVLGGLDPEGEVLDSCEKYNPNTDTWIPIASLPLPLYDTAGSFVPDYGKEAPQTLGYIYLAGGQTDNQELDETMTERGRGDEGEETECPQGSRVFIRYNIEQDRWEQLPPLPLAVTAASLQYLDDIGGPIPQLLSVVFGIDLPACSDSQTLWLIGGEGTEREVWYHQLDIRGNLVGEWIQGPKLRLWRSYPLIGRTFWRDSFHGDESRRRSGAKTSRDAGITSFGISNCASILVCGGRDQEGEVRKEIQILIRTPEGEWNWARPGDNPSQIPNSVLTLKIPVTMGAFGTEQWPETLATGGRPILFGGMPGLKSEDGVDGTVQFAQLRFIRGRFRRDPCLDEDKDACESEKNGGSGGSGSEWKRSARESEKNGGSGSEWKRSARESEVIPKGHRSEWNQAASMPDQRVFFETAPLSQSQVDEVTRVSRFLCMGGRTREGVTDRVQLFELPVPPTYLKPKVDKRRCCK